MKRGESQNVEYKRSWHEEYLRWICGFANAKGGTLWIGIDDDKSVHGVANAKKLLEDIPNTIRNTMGLVVEVSLLKKQRKDVIRIDVPESDFPVAYHGEYHFRTGSTKQQLTGFALTQFLFHKMHLAWDAVETVNRLPFRKYTFKRFKLRYEKKTGKEFRNTWFVSTGLATKDGILTNAGALFADECPIPQSRLFCTRWNGTTKAEDAADDQEHSGNLIELLDEAEAFVKRHSVKSWKKRPYDRVDYPDYPERAVTEALVNALIHRDYTIYGSEIHVDIFDDRLEIVSPGGMPDGSLVQDLDIRNVPSDRRNQILADIFSQMDYMERKGSGFGLIFRAYEKEAPNPKELKPSFVSASGSFRVVLPNLNGSVPFVGDVTENVTRNVTENVTRNVARKLSDIQSSILRMVSENPSISQGAIAEALKVNRRTVIRNMTAMSDVIRRVGPDKGGHWEVIGLK